MSKLIIEKETCKGCGLCVTFCPKKCIALSAETNANGYNYVTVINDDCIGCTSCAIMCPDSVIEIED